MGEIGRSHIETRPAEDLFSWRTNTDHLVTVAKLRELLDDMVRDGVPADATVQLSGPSIFAHWRRPA